MMPKSTLKTQVMEKLELVLDPELGVSIVALGLIYDVHVTKDGICKISMTLTTVGCPLFGQIQKEMEDRIMEIEAIEDVKIDLTFDPPWDTSKMSEEAKIQLGFD